MNLVEGERDFQQANVSDKRLQARVHNREGMQLTRYRSESGALSRAPAISCSRLDLKPDRNSSFYRGDSFPPARAKQTATLLLVREAHSQPPPPPGSLRASLFSALYACLRFPRSRKSDIYYRACPAISILSRRRFCLVLLLSESATSGQGTSFLHF